MGWQHKRPLSKLKTTRYQLAEAGCSGNASADNLPRSILRRLPKPMPAAITSAGAGKPDALIPAPTTATKPRRRPLRLIVAFDGDRATLPPAAVIAVPKCCSARRRLYAMLMYIWGNQGPLDSIITSAHTSQVKNDHRRRRHKGLGQWQSLKRNLALIISAPSGTCAGAGAGPVVMTDTDNTDGKAEADYADIRFECVSANETDPHPAITASLAWQPTQQLAGAYPGAAFIRHQR